MKHFFKLFSFLPALCMMYLIFSFSAQEGVDSGNLSFGLSQKIIKSADLIFDMEWSPEQVERYATKIHKPVRKLGHMTEYFLLAICISLPLYVYGLRGFLLLILAGGLCVAFACGDEYHQSFVEGRGPSKKDVLIDSIGVFFGVIMVRFFCWLTLIYAQAKSKPKTVKKKKKHSTVSYK